MRVRIGGDRDRAEVMASVTTGTLSYPLVADDNGAPQVAGRVVVRPATGLALGLSGARGAFVADEVRDQLPEAVGRRQYPQRALGADAEYSRDHWLVRTEAIGNAWSLPGIEAPLLDDVSVTSWLVEGKYAFHPQFYAAARYDRLWFGTIDGTTRSDTWDADVERVEVGVGYRVIRPVTVKASVQRVRRDGGRTRHDTLGAMQVVLWF